MRTLLAHRKQGLDVLDNPRRCFEVLVHPMVEVRKTTSV